MINGDIEEMGGKVTVKCPWHAYQIALETGEGLYMGVDMVRNGAGKIEATPPRVKSKGLKQRTHFVELRQGDIYVADSSTLGLCHDSLLYILRRRSRLVASARSQATCSSRTSTRSATSTSPSPRRERCASTPSSRPDHIDLTYE